MQSPLKKIVVYDLETGGLSCKYNSITEIAMVVIEVETLEIIEEFSVMIRPYMNLVHILEEGIKEAKIIFANLSTKDPETNINSMQYKGRSITLKSLEQFANDLEHFNNNYIQSHGTKITYENYLELRQSPQFADIAEVYLNHTYNPQALEITHIPIELLLQEGIEREEALMEIQDVIKKHTVGNNKPVLAGHNIKAFDNPIFEKFLQEGGVDLSKITNSFQIDTLDWARLRWFEMASFSLGVCANEVGLTLKEAHRALPDTVANAKFLVKLLKSLRGEGAQESKYVRRKFKFNF
tara:strand:+ start:694 stop:1578 length:885 start_codon:yes stop_codon:yes gene_type:complete